jgi:hypothetical protein
MGSLIEACLRWFPNWDIDFVRLFGRWGCDSSSTCGDGLPRYLDQHDLFQHPLQPSLNAREAQHNLATGM